MCRTDDGSRCMLMIYYTDLWLKRRCIGVCSVRLTQMNVCMTQASLISEPERPLADHTAFTNHSVAKRAKHLPSSPLSRHQQRRERVWVPTTKKMLHDRFDLTIWKICPLQFQCNIYDENSVKGLMQFHLKVSLQGATDAHILYLHTQ